MRTFDRALEGLTSIHWRLQVALALVLQHHHVEHTRNTSRAASERVCWHMMCYCSEK